MIINYLKIAVRQFKRSPLFSTLNVLGLTVGFAFSLLLLLGIYEEFTVDRQHDDIDHIYKAYFHGVNEETGEIPFVQDASPYVLKTELKNIDGVEKCIIYGPGNDMMVEAGGKVFKEVCAMGNPEIFSILSMPMLAGSIEMGIADPKTIYISKTTAEKYFGEEDLNLCIGKVLRLDDKTNYSIAGIFDNDGFKSNYNFDILYNIEQAAIAYGGNFTTHWGAKFGTVLVKLDPKVGTSTIEDQINTIYKDKPGYGVGGHAMMFRPLAEDHLWSKFENGIAVGGRIEYVRIFFWSALFLLIIACINFINLSTAQASKRAKEVGIRKTIGAKKSSLIFQFLAETGTLILIAVSLSLIIVNALLPSVNRLLDSDMTIPFASYSFWLVLVGIFLLLTLLSGLYPSFILSRFNPVKALNKRATSKFSQQNIRKGLVVFQFALSAILIISTLLVNNQVNFIMNQNFGLDRNNVIHISMPENIADKYETIKKVFKNDPRIETVSRTTSPPTNVSWIRMGFSWEGSDPDDSGFFYMLETDWGFDQLFDIRMKEGRFLDRNLKSDEDGVVINEKALDLIQMEDPIGKKIKTDDAQTWTIVGIAEDFNFKSIHDEIGPLMIKHNAERGGTLFIRANPNDIQGALASIESSWKSIFPNYPFEYSFLDETYAKMYKTESIMSVVAWYLAAIAIVVSCLGLFGLITFLANQKAKEIGIRKVLGASIASIVILLSKDFLKLIILGLLIAIPLSYFAISSWLENFAFKINITWWHFLVAAGIAVTLAMLAISFQSIKAAIANPVNALRSE